MGVLVTKKEAAESGGLVWRLKDDAEEWATGRSWLVRLPLLAYLIYALVQHLREPFYGTLLFGGITLVIHEIGHKLFAFLGEFMSIAGGTISQLLAPIATGFVFARQRDYFGISVAGMWLSFSMYNMATYMADAQETELPLVSLGVGDPIHDWDYMLSKLGLLAQDDALAGFVRLMAFVIAIASLAMAAWLCLVMFQTRDQRKLGSLS